MTRSKSVTEFMATCDLWQNELNALRQILLECGLAETIKWGLPVYMADGKNIAGIGSFKSYFGIWFFQGALLSDEANRLINAQKGKTKAMRQWRMFSAGDIDEKLIQAYIQEAILIQRSGSIIKPTTSDVLVLPPELQEAFKSSKDLAARFESFPKYKRKEFCDYISGAKRNETKVRRLNKIIPLIMEGRGLGDKYRK